MNRNNYETSFKERISYYTFFTGQNISFMFVLIFLSVYYTSVLGLSAATVGLIFLVARVWDAVNDPMLSILVERSRFKGGKFKPWINTVAWAVPVSTVLVFAFGDTVAELPMWMRVTYASVTYVAWGMLYTISDAPAYAMGTVMTKNSEERNEIYSYVRFFGFVGMLCAMVGAPKFVELLSGQWTYAALVLSGLAFLFMMPIRAVRERHVLQEQTPSLRKTVKTILSNRYLLIFLVSFVIISGCNFALTIAPFIARDVFEGAVSPIPFFDTTTLILLSILAPATLSALAVPSLIALLGKIKTFSAACFGMALLSVITWLVGHENLVLFLVLNCIKALTLGVTLVMPSIFIADCIEYGYRKSGQRLEALSFATQTFANKASAAMGGSIALGYLAMVGFVETTGGQQVIQSSAVIEGMWGILNIGHAIGIVVGLIIFVAGYKLNLDGQEAQSSALEDSVIPAA